VAGARGGVDRGAYAEANASQPDYAHRVLASSLPAPLLPRVRRVGSRPCL